MNAWLKTIRRLLSGGESGPAELRRARDKVLFDRASSEARYARFVVLLALATVIATGGVIVDSTATVVGAMIIAPLMTPLMGTALSAVTGDHRGISRSALIVLAGALGTVALSYVLTRLLPGGVDTMSNPQITGRTTVGLVELAIALASGSAGAFATVRDDVSDALPGVAISISLVPPLCVVGVCLAVGSSAQAGGALLLFVTNAVAILVAGSAVFTLAGLGRTARTELDRTAQRITIAATVLAMLLLLVPLAATTYRLSRDAIIEHRVEPVVARWLEGTDLRIQSLSVNGSALRIVLRGAGETPGVASLPTLIAGETGDELDVELQVTNAEYYEVGAP